MGDADGFPTLQWAKLEVKKLSTQLNQLHIDLDSSNTVSGLVGSCPVAPRSPTQPHAAPRRPTQPHAAPRRATRALRVLISRWGGAKLQGKMHAAGRGG